MDQGISITLTVICVVDKIKKASLTLMLTDALSTHRLHDLA